VSHPPKKLSAKQQRDTPRDDSFVYGCVLTFCNPGPIMTNEDLMEIYEAMVYQQKLLLDIKIQVESLKAMMFEHRPAFTEAFAEQVSKIVHTPQIQQMQSQIAELEAKLGLPR
jgi:hypothetical protein